MHQKQTNKKESQTSCLFLFLKPPHSPDFNIVFQSLYEILWAKKVYMYEWLTDVPLQHSLQLWFHISQYLPN